MERYSSNDADAVALASCGVCVFTPLLSNYMCRTYTGQSRSERGMAATERSGESQHGVRVSVACVVAMKQGRKRKEKKWRMLGKCRGMPSPRCQAIDFLFLRGTRSLSTFTVIMKTTPPLQLLSFPHYLFPPHAQPHTSHTQPCYCHVHDASKLQGLGNRPLRYGGACG
jgi:hypothetical protein